MNTKAAQRVILVGLLSLLVIAIGWMIGSAYGTWQNKRAIAQIEERDQALLLGKLSGIEEGQPFPDIPIWSLDGEHSSRIKEILPNGGVVVLLSVGCQSCVEEAATVQSTLLKLQDRGKPVVLILDGHAEGRHISREMDDYGVLLPVYVDTQHLLRHEFHVATRTAYFSISPEGLVDGIRAWKNDPSDLRHFLTVY